MIAGIDHIAIATIDFEASIRHHINGGYHEVLRAENIFNPAIKKQFQQYYSEKQSLCLLAREGQINIEIIKHSDKLSGKSFLDYNGSLVTVRSYAPGDSNLLFERLGFIASDDNIFFINSFGNKHYFQIQTVSKSDNYLDNEGFSCIALLSTYALKEYNILKQYGYAVTDIETLYINGKKLNVFFLKAPGGEIFEIIGIRNG